jgi:hypothetical protein
MIRAIRNWLRHPRPERHGIRYAKGTRERIGFLSRLEAETWAHQHLAGLWVSFFYCPLDMRIDPSRHGRVSEHPTVSN